MHLKACNPLDLRFRELGKVLLRQILKLLRRKANLGKDLLGIEVFIIIDHVVLALVFLFFALAHLIRYHLLIYFLRLLLVALGICDLADHILLLLLLLELLLL